MYDPKTDKAACMRTRVVSKCVDRTAMTHTHTHAHTHTERERENYTVMKVPEKREKCAIQRG